VDFRVFVVAMERNFDHIPAFRSIRHGGGDLRAKPAISGNAVSQGAIWMGDDDVRVAVEVPDCLQLAEHCGAIREVLNRPWRAE
jgi:hypothetical protein